MLAKLKAFVANVVLSVKTSPTTYAVVAVVAAYIGHKL